MYINIQTAVFCLLSVPHPVPRCDCCSQLTLLSTGASFRSLLCTSTSRQLYFACCQEAITRRHNLFRPVLMGNSAWRAIRQQSSRHSLMAQQTSARAHRQLCKACYQASLCNVFSCAPVMACHATKADYQKRAWPNISCTWDVCIEPCQY